MCCFAFTPPKKSRLRLEVGLVVEDRRVAGVGDEVRDVRARWKTRPAQGAAGSRHTSTAPAFISGHDLGRDRLDAVVGHGEDDEVGRGHGLGRGHRPHPAPRQVGEPGRRHLDVQHPVGGLLLHVVGDPAAHLAAGADQGHGAHRSSLRQTRTTCPLAADS